jgi:ABC-2 type transport system permease protein
MKPLWIIARREFLSRIRSRAFLFLALFFPLILIGGTFLPLLYSGSAEREYTLYVSDSSNRWGKLLESTPEYRVVPLTDSLVMPHGDALLILQGSSLLEPGTVRLLSEGPFAGEATLRDQLNRLARRDLLEEIPSQEVRLQLEQLEQAQVSLEYLPLAADNSPKAAMLLGSVATFLLYFFILLFSTQVLQGVMEEKSSRIAEVLLTSVSPFQLMLGKIVGIGMVGLLQGGIWILLGGGIALGFYLSGGMTDAALPLQELFEGFAYWGQSHSWALFITLFLLFFVGGYLLYSSLFAAIGSAVDTSADAQQLAFPAMIPIFIALYVGIYALTHPASLVTQVASFFPFTSPVVMMSRIAQGISRVEALTSLLLLYGTALLFVAAAGRIYRRGILLYGKRGSWRQLLRWIRL